MEGLFSDWGGIHFGKISYAKHDTVWTGFVDPLLIGANTNRDYYGTVGLRTKSYGDQMKILPFVKSAPYDNLKSLPESDYKPNRTFVSNLKWNNGVYEGEVINGVPEGFGFWYHNFNGSAEIGYYKSGYPHGLMARRSPGPTLNSFGVTGLAVFNNGIASKGVCSTYRGFYEGEVSLQITPAGRGKMTNIVIDGENVTEEGEFYGNVLNGSGKRTKANGSYESGTFQNGTFTSGFVKVTLPGLRVGDVIRVNGNKKLVRQTGLFEGSSRYVVLNDWSKLYETQKFEISFESDSEFYSSCSRCNGTGTLTEQRTSYTWIRNEYSESTKVDQAYGTITKTYTTTPKYSTRTSTINHSCSMCKGYGRLMK
jgi:hypothetical protein